MTEPREPVAEDPRAPYSALRPWESERDPSARSRAAAALALHIRYAETETHVARRRLRGGRRPGWIRPAWMSPARIRPTHRWLAPVVAMLVTAAAGGAVAAVLLRTEHTQRLAVFTSSGRLSPRFHVGARGRGYCWEASLASTASDAYRCFQGNLIHDPCFAATPHAASVACFIDPWHAVTELRLTRQLPRHGSVAQGPQLPWAIVTTDGRHCVYMTGATAPVAGERINYGCSDGTFLIGTPDTRTPLWTIRSVRRFLPSEMHAPLRDFAPVGIRQTIG